MRPPKATQTIETLKARCEMVNHPRFEMVGECWEWQHSYNSRGLAQIKHKGETLGARKLAYELAGNVVQPGNVTHAGCRNKKCINPAHTVQSTPGEYGIERQAVKYGKAIKPLAPAPKLERGSIWAGLGARV
jgi:hypothetical protein